MIINIIWSDCSKLIMQDWWYLGLGYRQKLSFPFTLNAFTFVCMYVCICVCMWIVPCPPLQAQQCSTRCGQPMRNRHRMFASDLLLCAVFCSTMALSSAFSLIRELHFWCKFEKVRNTRLLFHYLFIHPQTRRMYHCDVPLHSISTDTRLLDFPRRYSLRLSTASLPPTPKSKNTRPFNFT